MKKGFILTMMLAMATIVIAQEGYEPMLKVGKTWENYMLQGGMQDVRQTYLVSGDTVVDGEQCYKMHITLSDWHTGKLLMTYQPDIVLMEKEGKVWRLNGGQKDLWFDFSLSVGDKAPNNPAFTVTAIDRLAVGDRNLLRITLSGTVATMSGQEAMVEDYWVEGIGSTSGPWWSYEGGTDKSFGVLQGCYEDGYCLFNGNDFIPHQRLLEDGKAWTYVHYDTNNQASYYKYFIEGDTIVNNLSYMKLYQNDMTGYRCAMREEGKRVYCVMKGDSEEQLLYDFGVVGGDELTVMDVKGKVELTSVYNLYGSKCGSQEIAFTQDFNTVKVRWLDGIGSVEELLSPLTEYWGQNYLVYCEVKKQPLYVVPGHTVGIADAISPRPSANNAIFDLQGRRFSGKPEKGMYIQDGKKRIVR